jgi:transposase
MAETRRRFDRELREDAVRIVRKTDKPIRQVARDLPINDGTLGNRVMQERQASGETRPAGTSEDERAELAQLPQENPDRRSSPGSPARSGRAYHRPVPTPRTLICR